MPQPIAGDPATIADINIVFSNVLLVSLQLMAIVFFVMILVGGFKYITAGGDSGNVQSARKTLTVAIGGIVFVILAFLILQFIQVFTGAPVTNFNILEP